jgi:hypothetical protein
MIRIIITMKALKGGKHALLNLNLNREALLRWIRYR